MNTLSLYTNIQYTNTNNENNEYAENSVIHNIASNKLPTIAETVAKTVINIEIFKLPTIAETVAETVINFEILKEKKDIEGQQRSLENDSRQRSLEKNPKGVISSRSFNKIVKRSESDWKKKENLYLSIENHLWENNLLRENNDCLPSWEVAGPLNYGMSLEQMKDAITKKFKEMVNSGNLITEKQLAIDYDRNFFYQKNIKETNLTRIWGAEFLKSNLKDSLNLNVAEHFIIVENPESEIEVKVGCGDDPCVGRISNAYILSKKIIGTNAAWDYRSSPELNELGYADFKDFGNIICDSNNIGWIVDTELKGFDHPEWTRGDLAVRRYLQNRFKALNNLTDLQFTIKISPAVLNL